MHIACFISQLCHILFCGGLDPSGQHTALKRKTQQIQLRCAVKLSESSEKTEEMEKDRKQKEGYIECGANDRWLPVAVTECGEYVAMETAQSSGHSKHTVTGKCLVREGEIDEMKHRIKLLDIILSTSLLNLSEKAKKCISTYIFPIDFIDFHIFKSPVLFLKLCTLVALCHLAGSSLIPHWKYYSLEGDRTVDQWSVLSLEQLHVILQFT